MNTTQTQTIYLDNAATTRLSAESAAAMRAAEEAYANPASLHLAGVRAEEIVERARGSVAEAIGASADELYFTGSGTLASNLAIFGGARAKKRAGNRIVTTTIEHASVRESVKALENEGFETVFCPPTEAALRECINARTVLVSTMLVNNETGLILPVQCVPEIIREKHAPALFHIDAVQALGKIPINVRRLRCDLLTVSAHKIHGPKGCGALFVKRGVHILPLWQGGGQERGLASGTLNVPAIAGFGEAVKHHAPLAHLEAYFLEQAKECPFLQVNRDENPYAPHIINVSFMGYVGENVLHFLESKGIYVSVGSACSDSAHHGSILAAMGADRKTVDGAVRVSFGYETAERDIDAFFAAAKQAAQTLIKKYRR